MYFADEAIIVTNPEVSSVRDSDRIIGMLAAKTRRAERSEAPVKAHLLLTRYDPERVARGEMIKVEDVQEILAIPLLGVIPESQSVLRASNTGTPRRARWKTPMRQRVHGCRQAIPRRGPAPSLHRCRQTRLLLAPLRHRANVPTQGDSWHFWTSYRKRTPTAAQ